MKRLWYRLRWWFLDTFGERETWKTYTGYGNFTMIDGWMFRGRFFPCDPEDEP